MNLTTLNSPAIPNKPKALGIVLRLNFPRKEVISLLEFFTLLGIILIFDISMSSLPSISLSEISILFEYLLV